MKRPPTLMVWTINDAVIEQPEILASQFEALRSAGFGGVAPYVRCSRYAWNDPPARAAFRFIARLCRRHHMEFWIGADPRFVSRELIGEGPGLEMVLFGNAPRPEVFPHVVDIAGGRFSVRCDLTPRHVHTLKEVAIEFAPRGLAAVYAVRYEGDMPDKVVEITSRARFFFNARARYVEAFGMVPELAGDHWKALAFFRVATNHVDFSDREQMRRYLRMLSGLRREGLHADGLMWDEPGFTCTYGTLPFSQGIRREYSRSTRREILHDLWKLALPAADASAIRIAYYEAIQKTLNTANTAAAREARTLWGAQTASGVHDTWHFESADMCDMNHGSLDLWKAAKSKTGGFVDLGGIDQLKDPASPWYAHLAAMSVICTSLARGSSGKYAYNNLWTVGDDGGAGWQATVMDHCVNVMALFGTRWMAHAYGPVGTIGEERSFLGSPPLPGYPDHSTWPFFPGWNRRLREHLALAEDRLPESRLLVVFPVESMYALAGPAADGIAREVFSLILALLDAQYPIDVLAPSACMSGRWTGNDFLLGGVRYRAVVYPSPSVVPQDIVPILRRGKTRLFCVGDIPRRSARGGSISPGNFSSIVGTTDLLQRLEAIPELRPVRGPANCWVTRTPLASGSLVTVTPSRHGFRYKGTLTLESVAAELPESSGLTRVVFPVDGTPVVTAPQD